MRFALTVSALAILLVALPARASQAEAWGNLSGRFLLEGNKPALAPLPVPPGFCGAAPAPVPLPVDESVVVGANNELANVVVWVRTPKDIVVHPNYAALLKVAAVIDNKGCRFDPHIVISRLGQPLEIKNSDPVAHNTNVALQANTPFNFVLPANNAQQIQPLQKPENVPSMVSCNMHNWMKGWLVVPPTPYAAVSGTDGKFEIKDLPAGTEIEFQAWQEQKGYLDKATMNGKDAGWTKGRFKMTIKPGDNNLGDIKVSF